MSRDTEVKNKINTNKKMKKRGQIWVETAIYTLIGLAIIAIILSAAIPQINKVRDKGIVQQTSEALTVLNNKISDIEQSPGNIRIVDFKIGKGKLEINSEDNHIVYTLENTELELSEPGIEIKEGNIFLKTEKYGSKFNIILISKYDHLNITFDGEKKSKILQAGVTPYKIQIENKGSNSTSGDAKINIDFNLI